MVLIPAFNEAGSVYDLVARIKLLFDFPVVVIDDRSNDDTANQAAAAGAIVLRLPLRLGAWGATQTGLRYAQKHSWPIAVTIDADGQHDANCIQELIAPILAQEADVVIGSFPQRASSPRRLVWRYLRLLTGLQLKDITSGFRAYNSAAIQRLTHDDATLLDYQDIGVLMILRKERMRVIERCVVMQPRLNGSSRVFDSWFAVLKYIAQTSILALAGVGRRKSH